MQRTVQRSATKIRTLLEALLECRQRQLLTDTAEQSLLDSFTGVASSLLLNERRNSRIDKRGRRYSDDVKSFALTVYYYSPRGYNFLHSVFCLPNVSTLRDYNSSVDSTPSRTVDWHTAII